MPLPGRTGAGEPLLCSIFESPGRNYLKDLLDFGPAFLGPVKVPSDSSTDPSEWHNANDQLISISVFLDFAIGACECLELLHHGLRVVHGELRADAFHYNQETGAVKLINFGSGPRSFQNGLTSSGWLALSQELGIKHKLQYIAPEQTGRMPAEPDSRTDIYSLGIVFWTLLTGRAAFEGENPIDVIQAVLARRLPPVSSMRLEVPDAICNIIRRMTHKQIEDRYHSASGLKFDLIQIRQMLDNGDSEALANFNIGSEDVSSFFMLPSKQFGRDEAHATLVNVIKKVASWQRAPQERPNSSLYGLGTMSGSNVSDRHGSMDLVTRSSGASSPSTQSPPFVPHQPESAQQSASNGERAPQGSLNNQENRASVMTGLSTGSQRSGVRAEQSAKAVKYATQTPHRSESHPTRRRCRSELVSIIGAAGVGKSSLMTSVQTDIRKSGYFATAKFEPAKKAPFEPLLQAMSSLFRQIFSESEIDSEYHRLVASEVRPFWSSVCSMLDLPEGLINADRPTIASGSLLGSVVAQSGFNRSLQSEVMDGSSAHSTQSGGALTSELTRGSIVNSRSMKFITIFVEVLGILSSHKLICLCLDNVQFADDESLELLSSILERKLGILILVNMSLETSQTKADSTGNVSQW